MVVLRDACIAGDSTKHKPKKQMPPSSAACEGGSDIEAPCTLPPQLATTDSAPSNSGAGKKGKMTQQELIAAAAKRKDAKALAAVEGFEVCPSPHIPCILVFLHVTCRK